MPTPALTLVGRDPARGLVLPSRACLAPMEGITERVFRDLVIAEGGVGLACTEFLRISAASPASRSQIARDWRPGGVTPVQVQFMAAEPTHLAASIAQAEALGVPGIDLNFGCPAPRVFSRCAGSALLGHPERLGEMVRTAVAATTLPVTAKIRAGIGDADGLDRVVSTILDAGVAALCIHARLRCQGYHEAATWAWIERVVALRDRLRPGLPIIGNGGVETAADIAAMRGRTGCDAVMVGRAALADPWIFRVAAGGPPATPDEAVSFGLRYGEGLRLACGERRATARLKQYLKYVRAGGLFAGADDLRQALLRRQTLADLNEGLRAAGSRARTGSASAPAGAAP